MAKESLGSIIQFFWLSMAMGMLRMDGLQWKTPRQIQGLLTAAVGWGELKCPL